MSHAFEQEDSNTDWLVFLMVLFFIIALLWTHNEHSGSTGCFHGQNMVAMVYESIKRCDEVVKGDVVLLANNTHARVVCVVKNLKTPTNNIRLLKFPCGLIVTEYHPIKIQKWWCFPKDVPSIESYNEDFDAVYSFLLETADGSPVKHGMIIQGIECAPLGHNIEEKVVEHHFFGNFESVKKTLSAGNPDQYEKGLVEITNTKRGPDNKVCGYIFDEVY